MIELSKQRLKDERFLAAYSAVKPVATDQHRGAYFLAAYTAVNIPLDITGARGTFKPPIRRRTLKPLKIYYMDTFKPPIRRETAQSHAVKDH